MHASLCCHLTSDELILRKLTGEATIETLLTVPSPSTKNRVASHQRQPSTILDREKPVLYIAGQTLLMKERTDLWYLCQAQNVANRVVLSHLASSWAVECHLLAL